MFLLTPIRQYYWQILSMTMIQVRKIAMQSGLIFVKSYFSGIMRVTESSFFEGEELADGIQNAPKGQ